MLFTYRLNSTWSLTKHINKITTKRQTKWVTRSNGIRMIKNSKERVRDKSHRQTTLSLSMNDLIWWNVIIIKFTWRKTKMLTWLQVSRGTSSPVRKSRRRSQSAIKTRMTQFSSWLTQQRKRRCSPKKLLLRATCQLLCRASRQNLKLPNRTLSLRNSKSSNRNFSRRTTFKKFWVSKLAKSQTMNQRAQ